MERRIPVRTNDSKASISLHARDNSNGKKKPINKWLLPATACMLLFFCAAIFALTHGHRTEAGPQLETPKTSTPAVETGEPVTATTPKADDPVVGPMDDDAARIAMQQRLTEYNLEDTQAVPTGYVRIPPIPAGPRTKDDAYMHIIFSSGCNYFQHWQSELLLATASYVGQRGRLTRIVSGCHDKGAEHISHRHQTFPPGLNDVLVPLVELNRSVNDAFGLFVTPTFEGAKDFPWINKPSSIAHFIKHARPELDRMGEQVIVILDPDFVFVEPITQMPLPESAIIVSSASARGRVHPNVVLRGRPVAQHYGLGGQWVHKFDVKAIAGEDSPALKYTDSTANDFFSVGPPLMLHVDDLADLGPIWAKNMRDVLKVETDILADMWAYCMAAAHLGLEHTILDQYMVSTWAEHPEQANRWIDDWPSMQCLDPQQPSGSHQPNFIHLASNFKAPATKEWMFHKGHVPGMFLDCNTPLIKDAPDDLWTISTGYQAKQSAWVLCHTVSKLNRVAIDYKEKFCPSGYEKRKLVRLIQDKTKDEHCDVRKEKWCYPLAQIEDLPDDWRTVGPDKVVEE